MFLRACAASLLALSCSSASSSVGGAFPAEAYQTLTSDSGGMRIEVRTSPDQPPQHGVCDVELRIVDVTTGAPVTADVGVIPWMAAHDHGTSVVPTVTPREPGRYVVSNVELFMPGTWQLRTTIASDHAIPTVDVR